MDQKHSAHALGGHLAALFTITVWAMTFISTKLLIGVFGAMDLTFLRVIVAYLALCALGPRPIRTKRVREEIPFVLAGLLGVTAYFLFQNIGLNYTMATNASIILNTIPIFTALLAWWFLKDRAGIHSFFLVGFVLSMIGISIISFSGERAGLHLFGDALTFGAALVWGMYTLISQKINGGGYSAILVTRRVYFWGLVGMVPAMFAFRFRPDIHLIIRPQNLLNLLFLGVVASAVCFVTWNFAIRRLGSVKASIYIYGQPVVTVVASALILHEKMTPRLISGIVISLLGVLISGIKPCERTRDRSVASQAGGR